MKHIRISEGFGILDSFEPHNFHKALIFINISFLTTLTFHAVFERFIYVADFTLGHECEENGAK